MKQQTKRLAYGANRATLSGPKTKQYRIRQNALVFARELRAAGSGVEKWTNITNKHFNRVAKRLLDKGISHGRIAELFSAARHICRAYGNNRIAPGNRTFGVRRGSIANQRTRAMDPETIQEVLERLRQDPYRHAARAAAQIEIMHELGLRREEAAKVDLVADWDRPGHTLLVQHGTKGGRPRVLQLSPRQEDVLERATPFISRSNRPGVHTLQPEGMGDEWQNRLSYAARKNGLTKGDTGFTLHGLRHERFREMYVERTGFEPPNRHASIQAFQQAAKGVAGDEWPRLDGAVRDAIEVTAGHSKGRRDVSNAYLGSSR